MVELAGCCHLRLNMFACVGVCPIQFLKRVFGIAIVCLRYLHCIPVMDLAQKADLMPKQLMTVQHGRLIKRG